MENDLTTIEEMRIEERIKEPFISFFSASLDEKRKIAFSILQTKKEDLFLISSYGFSLALIFAGLSEQHIEYIAKNAPKNYKENIFKTLQDQKVLQEVFEIAKTMDEYLGENISQNQKRLKNVIQYIKDNKAVFEF